MCKKKDRIIVSVKKQQTRYLKTSHKFGIELHKTMKKALALVATNVNIL